MPVDVAVEEPRAGVVGREADGDVVGDAVGGIVAEGHDVAPGRGVPVVRGLARAADDVEGVAVQVEGVRVAGERAAGHGELDGAVGRKGVQAAGGQEVGGGRRAAEDLEENRAGGRRPGYVVSHVRISAAQELPRPCSLKPLV